MSTLVLIPPSLNTGYQDQIRQLQDLQDQWLQQQQLHQQSLRNQQPQESHASDDSADPSAATSGGRIQPAAAESDGGGVGGNGEGAATGDESATTQGAQLLAMLVFMAEMIRQQLVPQLLKNQQAQQDAPESPSGSPSSASGGDSPNAIPPGPVGTQTDGATSAPDVAETQAQSDAMPPGSAGPTSTQPAPPPPPSAAPPDAATPSPAAAPTVTTQPAPVASATGADGTSAAVDGGGPRSLDLVNATDKALPVAFFRNLAPGEHPSFNGPEAQFKIPPHSSLNVSMPEDWQGRVQKWSGNTQDPSNWAEINFEKSSHKVWFDESEILGRNSSMTIEAADGASGGSAKSILDKADPDLKAVDAAGNEVIKPPQWFDGKTNQQAVDFLDKELGNKNVYVLPDDNNAVRTSNADSLKITFGEA